MRRSLLLSLGGLIIISTPLIALSLLHASPGPGAPAYWSPARNISNSPEGIAGPRIALDNNDYLHLIWIDNRTGSAGLYYTRSIDGGTNWSAFEPITTTLAFRQGDMDVDTSGSVHAVWVEVWNELEQQYYIQYGIKPSGDDWQVSTLPGLVLQNSPAIAVSNDYVHVAWLREIGNLSTFYSRKPVSEGSWTTPAPITTTATTSLSPDIAVDSEGNVHAVWQENIARGAIYYSKETYGGGIGWSPVITVSQSLTGCATPAIALGTDNYVHVVWGQRISEDEQYVYYANFPSNDPSSITPTQVFTEAMGVSKEAPTYLYPRVAIRGDEVHLVWHGKGETDITDQVWYAVSEDRGNSWSSPIKIFRDPTRQDLAPGIALDEKIGHVVWQGKDENDKYQVIYSPGFPYAIYLPMVTKSYPGG